MKAVIYVTIFILNIMCVSTIYAEETNQELNYSDKLALIKKQFSAGTRSSAEILLPYWDEIVAKEQQLKAQEIKGIKDPNFNKESFRLFVSEVRILLWSRGRNDPRVKQLYYNEFKERGRFAGLYVRSAEDPNIAVHELLNTRSDEDDQIMKVIYDYYVNGEDHNPARWLVMTAEIFERMSASALAQDVFDETGSFYVLNYALFLLRSSNFKFLDSEINKDEYHKRSLGVQLKYMFSTIGKVGNSSKYNYFFGVNEDMDIVMENKYASFWKHYQVLSKHCAYTLENLKIYTPEEKGFQRIAMLSFRASLKDESVKDELRDSFGDIDSIPMIGFFLRMYEEIVDSTDVSFLKKMKSRDICFKVTPVDVEIAQECKAHGMQWDIREEIWPVKEAINRIFKKIGYTE
jgi:hypothetical protein